MTDVSSHLALLNRTVILTAVEALQKHDYKTLQHMGADPKTVEQLQTLDLDSMVFARTLQTSLIDIKFNLKAMELLFKHTSREAARERLINEAIRLGLRQPMLYAFTGINRREFSDRRRTLNLPKHATGRIEKLQEDDEIQVMTAYHRLTTGEATYEPLEILVCVGRETGLRLDQVWTALEDSGGIDLTAV